MKYKEALELLNEGKKVRLPEWLGFFFRQENGHLKQFSKVGDVLHPWPEHDDSILGLMKRTDWEEVTEGLGFDFAILALKAGKKVAREGWNGSGMYAVYMPGYPDGVEVNAVTQKAHNLPAGTKLVYRPYMQLFTAQGDVAMWAPSGSDCLATDWIVVD